MTGTLRPPEHFVHGLGGPEVVVPARVVSWLVRATDFPALRRRARTDPQVANVLAALALVAAEWSVTAGPGRNPRQSPEEQPRLVLQVFTTVEASHFVGLTDRAVRAAITEGRLSATKNAAGRWRISRGDLEDFRAARAA